MREADAAVRLPGNAPADTYLRADLVLEAARRAGADAIHPGYGFLSENADFARAVIDAGLTWVGPAPESIEPMGSKIEAKKLMAGAGVPVLGNLDAETATEADLPLLVKASAGGGGRGMRIVRDPGRPARRDRRRPRAEAASAFGDGTVFVEPYVEHGRHVEVQVVGDTPRQRRGPRRARLLDPAPAPEGRRGGAGARARRRRPARALHEAARGGRRGDRLRGRRHRRVPRRRRDAAAFSSWR